MKQPGAAATAHNGRSLFPFPLPIITERIIAPFFND